jgi:hypothetical protein
MVCNRLNIHRKDRDFAFGASFLIDELTQGLAIDSPGNAGFFPSLVFRRFAGAFSDLSMPLGNDPSLTAACGHEAYTTFVDGDGC